MDLYFKMEYRVRIALAALLWIGYFILYRMIYEILGAGANALSLLPVAGTAWIIGTNWGVATGLISLPINILLEYLLSGSINQSLSPIGFIGTLVTVTAAYTIGRVFEVNKRVYKELQRRQEMEIVLQERTDQLQQQKQYFENLIQNSPIAIVTLSPDQEVKSCNPSFEHLFGYKEEEILGKDIDSLVAGSTYLAEAREISEMVQSGASVQASGKRLTKDGVSIDVDIYGVPVMIDGKQDGILGQYVDVTEKNRVETALKEQLQFLQTIIDVIPAPVFYNDAEGKFLGWNNAFELSVGKTKDQIYGKNLSEVFPEEAELFGADLDKKLYDHPGTPLVEERIIDLGGFELVIMIHRSTFNDINGNVAGTITVGFDITEIKQKEKEIQTSEARFRSLFEHAPDGVVITNTTGTILSWNPAAERIFGYTHEELYGENLSIIMPQSKDREHHAGFQLILEEGLSHFIEQNVELEGRSKEGRIFPMEMSFAGWDTHDETYFVGILRDISERKKFENELLQAKSAAEDAAQVKGQFLAHMSHEIRTPLHAIIGMTNLLHETQLSYDQKGFVETIQISGENLLGVINQILDFSLIEAGKLVMDSLPYNLRTCIETALDLVAPTAVQKGLNLAYTIESSTPSKLIGDETRVQQILINLLANAIKFTQEGEVVVEVNSQRINKKSHKIFFSVHDTGIGISPEGKEMLFQSFSQVDSSLKRKYGGTGLGLSICKELIEAMGGEIQVESEVGKGSIFSFWIVSEAVPETTPLFPAGIQPELHNKRILIVDQNLTNIQILAHQTRAWGMEAHTFRSAEEVVKLLEQGEKFDVAILGQELASPTGNSLAKTIRSFPGSEEMPIVMLRVLGLEKTHEGEDSEVYDAILTKPIKPEPLYETIMKTLQNDTAPSSEIPAKIDSQLAKKHALKILVAEDNVFNQEVVIKTLELMGYQPDIVSNGFEVIHALETQTYDLILMDIQMPELDGEKATDLIREHFQHERQPYIVAMTAHAMDQDQERYLSSGMDYFISKPIMIEDLVDILESISHNLSKRKAGIDHGTSIKVKSVSPILDQYQHSMNEDDFRSMLFHLIDTFHRETEQHFHQLLDAYHSEENESFKRAAHNLKSSGITFGLTDFADLAIELEKRNCVDESGETWNIIEQCQVEYEKAKIILEELRLEI